MSIKNLIQKYEKEKEDIQEKVSSLKERDKLLDVLLKELRSATRGMARGGKKAPAKKKRGRKKRGGVTVREAILSAVASAGDAVNAGVIIEKAKKLSGGAEASIRTQINALTRAGELQQVPYAGRGYKYRIAGKAKAAPKKAAKKATKRAAKKAAKKAAS